MAESQNIEYKKSWRDEYLKWICGFANAFFRTGLVDAWGRGIEKILNECKQHGAHPPIFKYEPSGLMLLFKGIIPDSQDKSTSETIKKSSLKIVLFMQEDKNITITM